MTLADGEKSAGTHSLLFDKPLSSGIYFYQLNAVSVDGKENYYSIKKMLLLK